MADVVQSVTVQGDYGTLWHCVGLCGTVIVEYQCNSHLEGKILSMLRPTFSVNFSFTVRNKTLERVLRSVKIYKIFTEFIIF